MDFLNVIYLPDESLPTDIKSSLFRYSNWGIISLTFLQLNLFFSRWPVRDTLRKEFCEVSAAISAWWKLWTETCGFGNGSLSIDNTMLESLAFLARVFLRYNLSTTITSHNGECIVYSAHRRIYIYILHILHIVYLCTLYVSSLSSTTIAYTLSGTRYPLFSARDLEPSFFPPPRGGIIISRDTTESGTLRKQGAWTPCTQSART